MTNSPWAVRRTNTYAEQPICAEARRRAHYATGSRRTTNLEHSNALLSFRGLDRSSEGHRVAVHIHSARTDPRALPRSASEGAWPQEHSRRTSTSGRCEVLRGSGGGPLRHT